MIQCDPGHRHTCIYEYLVRRTVTIKIKTNTRIKTEERKTRWSGVFNKLLSLWSDTMYQTAINKYDLLTDIKHTKLKYADMILISGEFYQHSVIHIWVQRYRSDNSIPTVMWHILQTIYNGRMGELHSSTAFKRHYKHRKEVESRSRWEPLWEVPKIPASESFHLAIIWWKQSKTSDSPA